MNLKGRKGKQTHLRKENIRRRLQDLCKNFGVTWQHVRSTYNRQMKYPSVK